MKKYLTILLLAITGASPAQQKKHDYSLIQPRQWIIPNSNGMSYSIDTFRGSKALIITKKFDNYKFGAVAYPRGLNFTDGEIDLDMVSGNGQDYLGLAFRIRDAHHYQTLYFRPASSGTINAIQYMPAKKDEFDWWDYEA